MESSAKEYIQLLLEQSAATAATLRIMEEKGGKGEEGGLEEEREEERQGIMEDVLVKAWTDALMPVLRDICMKGEKTIPSSLCIQVGELLAMHTWLPCLLTLFNVFIRWPVCNL